jgi:AcrR family transcriptional regulator
VIIEENTGLRSQILDQATRLFVTRGYSSISMREIAEACGVTKAALYYHFKDKEHLIMAILEGYLDEIGVLIKASRNVVGTNREKISYMVRSILIQDPEKRALIRLAMQEMSNLSPQSRAYFGQIYYDKFVGQIEALLSEGVNSGELRSLDPKATTWILLGMMYPFFYPGHDREMGNPEEIIPFLVSVFFEGVSQR